MRLWAAVIAGLLALPGFAQAEPVRVGSKKFTESLILGEVVAGALRAGGLESEHVRELGGSRILWNALISGEIDVYPEYTGTLVQELLADVPGDLSTPAGRESALGERGLVELVSLGSVNATVVEPMNVFRVAVLKGAVKVILVHNHPGGEVKASQDDKEITDRLIQVGRILNIEVLDHLIITTTTFSSFAEIGLMQTLRQSTKWVPAYELVARIRQEEKMLRKQAVKAAKESGMRKGRQEGLKEGEQIGLEKGKIEMAKAMKRKGIDQTTIEEISGLSLTDIETL